MILDAVAKALAPALKSIEKRLAALEQQQAKTLADSFRGAWDPATTYRKGDVVQRSSAVWLALRDPTAAPGDGDSGWRLLIKSPR